MSYTLSPPSHFSIFTPPHLVAEYRFARFQTPQLHIGLVRFHQKMDTRILKHRGAAPKLMEGNFQARGLTTLEGPKLCSTNRMVYLFQIWPYETQVRSINLTNSFMYRDYRRYLRRSRIGFPYRDLPLYTSSLCLSLKLWDHSSCTLSSYSCFISTSRIFPRA